MRFMTNIFETIGIQKKNMDIDYDLSRLYLIQFHDPLDCVICFLCNIQCNEYFFLCQHWTWFWLHAKYLIHSGIFWMFGYEFRNGFHFFVTEKCISILNSTVKLIKSKHWWENYERNDIYEKQWMENKRPGKIHNQDLKYNYFWNCVSNERSKFVRIKYLLW